MAKIGATATPLFKTELGRGTGLLLSRTGILDPRVAEA